MTVRYDIRKARKAAGKTQQDVAEHLKVSVQAVSQWENGHTLPSATNLFSLSDYLGIDKATSFELLDRVDEVSSRRIASAVAPVVDWKDPENWHLYNNSFDFTDHETNKYKDAEAFLEISWKPVGEIYALKLTGYSVMPNAAKGDHIIIDTGRAPEPDDYVVAKLDAENTARLGQFQPKGYDKHRALIFELNIGDHRTARLFNAENPGHIIGTVREHRRYYRTS